MNGNHENCAEQLDKLSQTVRTILLSLNDVIARVKPMETKIVNLETEVNLLKEEIKDLNDERQSVDQAVMVRKTMAEESKSLTRLDEKINLLEDKVQTLQVKTTEQSKMERTVSTHEIRNATEQMERQFNCTRKFFSEHSLWRHMETSHPKMEPKLFKCKHCVTIFHSRESVWMHIINDHIDTIAPYNLPDQSNHSSESQVPFSPQN